MVIDAGKGMKSAPASSLKSTRLRGIPMLTFMNKLARPALNPLQLLDDLENVLGIGGFPVLAAGRR